MIAIAAVFLLLLFGASFIAVTERLAHGGWRHAFASPLGEAARLIAQQATRTERPDGVNWLIAPIGYLMVATAGLSVVPFAPGVAVANLDAGIVLWGSCEALTIVLVFLHGWSANSLLPLIGGYRYVAVALPAMLISMFVLIGAALPARSLSVAAMVAAQEPIWNVVRQPLGLPLFLLLGLTIGLRGPFDYADGADLATGTSAEVSGRARLGWRVARLAMTTAFAAMAATAFLGGYLGPWRPGPVWLIIKTALVLVLMVILGRNLARMPAPWMLSLIWTLLLPLSFLDLVIAGVVALS
jgi:NADH-quinone oxidoreductase subunit H